MYKCELNIIYIMKTKIKLICLMLFLGLIFYQVFLQVSNGANVSLRVDSHVKEKKELALLYINGVLQDTVYFAAVHPYRESHKFLLGENTILIQSIDDQSRYEATVFYFGLYTWLFIRYTSETVEMKRFYMQPKYR